MSQLHFDWVGSGELPLLAEWDEFVTKSPRGHYCALSTWLRSFEAYGLRTLVLLARREKGGAVIGGMGCLTFGALGFLGVTAPIGPLVNIGDDDAAKPILEESIRKARQLGAFLFQAQAPVPEVASLPFLLPCLSDVPMLPGRPFSAGAAPDQMLWIDFARVEASEERLWRERMLGTFNSNTRRNIRRAEKANLQIEEAVSEPEVKAGFALIEENGIEQGYATRSWGEFGATLLEQVRLDQATILVARSEGRIVGSHYSVRAGQRCSYLMGGTARLEEDLGIGHALHWSAMVRARNSGLLGYDLTTSGPPGVLRFKMGFHPDLIKLTPAQHTVLRPLRFRIFDSMYPFARKHKRTVANMLRGVGMGR